MTSEKRPICPSCESSNVAKIVFGYPSPELIEEAQRGDVALGGCCIGPDNPEWQCNDCEHKW